MTLGNFTDSNHLAHRSVYDLANEATTDASKYNYQQINPLTGVPQSPTIPNTLTDLQKLAQQWNQQPKTFVDTRDYYKQQFKMENFKTPVHELLDSLFTLEEMEEYLLTMDYRKIPGSSYLVKGDPDPEFKRTFTITEAFYAEMTIKLKNTLLAKGQLKLKI